MSEGAAAEGREAPSAVRGARGAASDGDAPRSEAPQSDEALRGEAPQGEGSENDAPQGGGSDGDVPQGGASRGEAPRESASGKDAAEARVSKSSAAAASSGSPAVAETVARSGDPARTEAVAASGETGDASKIPAPSGTPRASEAPASEPEGASAAADASESPASSGAPSAPAATPDPSASAAASASSTPTTPTPADDRSFEPGVAPAAASGLQGRGAGDSTEPDAPEADKGRQEASGATSGRDEKSAREDSDSAPDTEASAPTDPTAPGIQDDSGSSDAESRDSASGDPEAPGDGDRDDLPDAPAKSETSASTSWGRSRTAAEDAPAADVPDSDPPVDRETAVFKAFERTRPEPVDQPTTTLKVPTPPPARSNPGTSASTFVPLRRDEKSEVRATPPPSKPTPFPGSTGTGTGTGNSTSTGTKTGTGTGTNTPLPTPTPALSNAERTRQQPMPPMPPLDLLAELTNTPPPPQTPVRTAVRRVKIWTPLVLLVLIIFAIVQALRPLPDPKLALTAPATFTFDGGKLELPWPSEGQGAVEVEGVGSLGKYGAGKPAPIASVAKTMTAYVILKDHPITGKQVGPKIEVDKQAGEESNRPDESTAPLQEGQEYTQKEMLQLLMIPSGNNAARLLARWDAGSEKAFVAKMNAAAKDLGMTNSTYTDPSGLMKTTVSTPADQLKLAEAVVQNDVFREIVNTPDIEIPGIGKRIFNNNKILAEPGVSGIKTGSSTPAGGNLLWTAQTIIDGQNRRIIGIVMGAQQATTLDDKLNLAIQNSLKLIQAAQDGVTSAAVVKKGEVVGHVDDGLGGTTAVVATKDLKPVGWGGLKVTLKLGDKGTKVPHTAKAGTVVGELTIGSGDGKVSTPVALRKDLAEPGFGAKLTRIG
ncbi:D-alanyl-D-alanine carboxypeptidase [Streptomyces liangshanensis]|uniref:D-alanyl-D-alanine carboxypeptidase n=1 Tax=Streptomyces liangshanensis TaxID=2717324 RepID=A0A6G9H8Y6_9ACTN|nr:D-alanyl-D-alanine carboxypeptidase [Streptomyces liangshanensis]